MVVVVPPCVVLVVDPGCDVVVDCRDVVDVTASPAVVLVVVDDVLEVVVVLRLVVLVGPSPDVVVVPSPTTPGSGSVVVVVGELLPA